MKKNWPPRILTSKETLDRLENDNVSMGRFGDGEVSLMALVPIGFQKVSLKLKRDLIEVAKCNDSDFLSCIPIFINNKNSLKEASRKWWTSNLRLMGVFWRRYFSTGITYGDTEVTRPWMSFLDEEHASECFSRMRNIFSGKDIVLIEGEKSRLGVGNDFLSKAKSVRRILGPAKNAYSKIDEIYDAAICEDKNALYLLALGPTATVLSYRLYKSGRRALDIGHMDIEYEWFKIKATDKVPVKNKYVNEAGGYKVLEEDATLEKKYLYEIVRIIK